MWDEWSYPPPLLTWGLPDPRIAEPLLNKKVFGRRSMIGVYPLDLPRSPYWSSEGNHFQKPTMPYHPSLTSSSVHNSSHQWTALCFVLHLPLVPKNELKQQFTTTTYLKQRNCNISTVKNLLYFFKGQHLIIIFNQIKPNQGCGVEVVASAK